MISRFVYPSSLPSILPSFSNRYKIETMVWIQPKWSGETIPPRGFHSASLIGRTLYVSCSLFLSLNIGSSLDVILSSYSSSLPRNRYLEVQASLMLWNRGVWNTTTISLLWILVRCLSYHPTIFLSLSRSFSILSPHSPSVYSPSSLLLLVFSGGVIELGVVARPASDTPSTSTPSTTETVNSAPTHE